jgi:hypothetical protein
MTFENFVTEKNTDVNEWLGQKFITGHGPGKKDQSIKRIEQEIDTELEKYKANPEMYVPINPEILKDKLLKAAKENGYRGLVKSQKSPSDPKAFGAGKLFITYVPENTGLQNLGTGAASGTGTKLMGNF